MIYGSVCSGIEAASVAWEPLGWRPAFFSEIDPFACAVLAHRFGANPLGEPVPANGVPNHGDMTRFKEWPDADLDVLVGGTPCQAFSVAGLRRGLDDPRGNLTLVYLGLVERYRPRWVVWENVPGVMSQDGGRAFGAFIGGLAQLGNGFAWRVLDAQYVRVDGYPRAVPQRRQRVFVVGHSSDWRRAAAVLFEPEGLRGDPPPRREAGQGIAATLTRGAESSGKGGYAGRRREDDVNLVQAVAYGGNNTAGPIDVATALNAHGGPCGRMDFESETFVAQAVAPTLDASFGRLQGASGQDLNHGHGHLIVHTLRAEGFDASEDGTGRGTPLVPVSPSLRAQSQSSHRADSEAFVPCNSAVRRLTPLECERLQGFPDGWTAIPHRGRSAADGPRYKAIGNSMAVNVMRWIGQRIELMETVTRRAAA